MEYYFRNLSNEDRNTVIDIFNYYIENSFAAFFETKVRYVFFDEIMRMTEGYPRITIRTKSGEIVGFSFLRPYSPIPTFKRSADISYFIKPTHTRNGIGKLALEYLIKEAKKLSIESILASISSLNEPSIRFHQKNDFVPCGTLSKIGKKHNKDFDVIIMQRVI